MSTDAEVVEEALRCVVREIHEALEHLGAFEAGGSFSGQIFITEEGPLIDLAASPNDKTGEIDWDIQFVPKEDL